MQELYQIRESVERRVREITAAHPGWPCRKGCDECCRSLAAVPRVSGAEWAPISEAIEALPADVAAGVRRRVRESAGASRPVTCPLLDTENGARLVYEARPVACRGYGFYAERGAVLGCWRIEAIAAEKSEVVWGNHTALEDRLASLGPATELAEWLERTERDNCPEGPGEESAGTS